MRPLKLNRKCPLCECNNGKKLGTLKYTLFDDNPLPNEYTIISCNKCGLIFYDTSLIQSNYSDFYMNCIRGSEYDNVKSDINESKYIENIINIISPYIIDKNSNICDIGCGNGLLLKKLKSFNYTNLYGVDLSQSCIEPLKQEGINVGNGSVLNIPFDTKMDIIIVSHILEHIIDIKSSLESIRNKLSNNGIIYVEVPNTNSYNKTKNISPIKYFHHQHITHFDKFHLINLFENNGYTKILSGHSSRLKEDLKIPCIWGIFKKNDIKINEIKQNFTLSYKIKVWFNNIDLDTDNILLNLEMSKKVTYIWGVGMHMKMLLSMSPLRNCNIKYFIDSNKNYYNKTINNKNIHSPDILYNATKNDAIVICTLSNSNEMINYLINDVKFKGEIITCNFGNVEKYDD